MRWWFRSILHGAGRAFDLSASTYRVRRSCSPQQLMDRAADLSLRAESLWGPGPSWAAHAIRVEGLDHEIENAVTRIRKEIREDDRAKASKDLDAKGWRSEKLDKNGWLKGTWKAVSGANVAQGSTKSGQGRDIPASRLSRDKQSETHIDSPSKKRKRR